MGCPQVELEVRRGGHYAAGLRPSQKHRQPEKGGDSRTRGQKALEADSAGHNGVPINYLLCVVIQGSGGGRRAGKRAAQNIVNCGHFGQSIRYNKK